MPLYIPSGRGCSPPVTELHGKGGLHAENSARRGKGVKSNSNTEVHTPAERHAAMTWAQRLKRVFSIDIEVCSRCGGSARVITCIEDQDVIDRILDHLRQKEQETPTRPLLVPPTRAPPGTLPLFAGKDSRPTAPH